MHRKHIALLVALAAAFILTVPSHAQDPGALDTIQVGVANVDAGDHFPVPIRMFNDETVEAISLGFWWNDPDVFLDSVSWIGSNAIHISTRPIGIDNVNFSVLIGVIKIFEAPIQPGDSLLATLWFTADGGAVDQIILIDSGFVPPAGTWKFNIGGGAASFGPQYIEGKIIIGDPQPPPEFVVSTGALDFEAFEGGPDPTPQTFSIINGGGQTLNWTAAWNSSWLNVSPPTGTAPSTVTVSPDISALPAGAYEDTITLTDPNATNSPQQVVVTLDVIVPPPIIELVPDNFTFLAQQDSANPAIQSMQINDNGSGALSWTAANSEAWLTLSAYSGTAGASVDLMVDITGMTFGTYFDTIVVTDPAASNSPQRAPVELTIVSGFPIIALEPDSFYCAATAGIDPYDRPIFITNEGGDWLRYTITSKKGWMSFTPNIDSVLAGETVAPIVSFSTDPLNYGLRYDTILVTAPSALNSPQEIPVTIWKMEGNVPELSVSPNPVVINAWECYNWPRLTPVPITVENIGGEFLNWTAYWDAPWLSISPSTGVNDKTIYASASIIGMPIGTYIDTVAIVPELSINPPESIEVVLTISEQTLTPVLGVPKTYYRFIFKNKQVGTNEQPVDIVNLASGCMDWYATENTTWLDVSPDSGGINDDVWVGVNGFGLPLGKTSGSFEINSNDATNGPIEVDVDLYIWTFGDANCDGQVDIEDVVYDLAYVFLGGPAPCPEIWVGDLNCSHTVDIDDAVYLIAWIFLHGPAPCDYDVGPPLAPAVHTFQDDMK
ncbi:MAG: hypothetical protein KKH67_15015 [candidate division Zixibacteria bacterium]|nr:hypothetical protein [candidate division Zixibacteria bacterium]MBU1470626.1 hypothetical protein [candidate division Zixibacteria bacterium]